MNVCAQVLRTCTFSFLMGWVWNCWVIWLLYILLVWHVFILVFCSPVGISTFWISLSLSLHSNRSRLWLSHILFLFSCQGFPLRLHPCMIPLFPERPPSPFKIEDERKSRKDKERYHNIVSLIVKLPLCMLLPPGRWRLKCSSSSHLVKCAFYQMSYLLGPLCFFFFFSCNIDVLTVSIISYVTCAFVCLGRKFLYTFFPKKFTCWCLQLDFQSIWIILCLLYNK